jgi:hypothetical protein
VELDYYAALSLVCLLTLATTLKLTLTGRVTVGTDKKATVFFHPYSLGPLVVMVPFVIGRYLKGSLSPWPVDAFTAMEAKAGLWAGVLAGIATTTVDLWMFWTTATALLTFTKPMANIYEPVPKSMHKYFHLANLIAGAYIVYKALNYHPAA